MVYEGTWFGAVGIITKAKALIDQLKPADLADVLDEVEMQGPNLRSGTAVIYPGEDSLPPFTVSEEISEGFFRVEVYLESPADLKTAVKKAEKVVDKIRGDETLGGAVDFAWVRRFAVPPNLLPRFYTWSILIEVAFRKIQA